MNKEGVEEVVEEKHQMNKTGSRTLGLLVVLGHQNQQSKYLWVEVVDGGDYEEILTGLLGCTWAGRQLDRCWGEFAVVIVIWTGDACGDDGGDSKAEEDRVVGARSFGAAAPMGGVWILVLAN
jgi:hypothetical protein